MSKSQRNSNGDRPRVTARCSPLRAAAINMLAPGRNFLFPFSHMKPPSNKAADAIIGKKSVDNADQCPQVAAVSELPESEVQGRGSVRKLVQDPYCLAYVFANLPDDGSNVAITCPVSGHTFYASVMERL